MWKTNCFQPPSKSSEATVRVQRFVALFLVILPPFLLAPLDLGILSLRRTESTSTFQTREPPGPTRGLVSEPFSLALFLLPAFHKGLPTLRRNKSDQGPRAATTWKCLYLDSSPAGSAIAASSQLTWTPGQGLLTGSSRPLLTERPCGKTRSALGNITQKRQSASPPRSGNTPALRAASGEGSGHTEGAGEPEHARGKNAMFYWVTVRGARWPEEGLS